MAFALPLLDAMIPAVTATTKTVASPARLRRLGDLGAEVRVMMAQAATQFVSPLTFQALSGNPVHSELLDPKFEPDAVEEPQLLFRCDAELEFDESRRYGRRPKVELLLRLGVPGPWTDWGREIWEPEESSCVFEGEELRAAGWVARLYSGRAELEGADEKQFLDRGLQRMQGVRSMLESLDAYPYRNLHVAVARAAGRSGFAVVDLLPAFEGRDAADLRILPRDKTHPNAKGQRVAAEAIRRFLLDRGLPGRAAPTAPELAEAAEPAPGPDSLGR